MPDTYDDMYINMYLNYRRNVIFVPLWFALLLPNVQDQSLIIINDLGELTRCAKVEKQNE